MKTAKDFFFFNYEGAVLDLHQNQIEKIISLMENYAQMKVNELNKSDVIKSVCPTCNCIAGTICGNSWHLYNNY